MQHEVSGVKAPQRIRALTGLEPGAWVPARTQHGYWSIVTRFVPVDTTGDISNLLIILTSS